MDKNLQNMIENLNKKKIQNEEVRLETNSESSTEVENPNQLEESINIINFYDWWEMFNNKNMISDISRVNQEVSQTNVKDTIIFKVPKGKENTDQKELVVFYNPSNRPILCIPPVSMKVFKNDTFEVLHVYNDKFFIKSYGVKTGLILVFCVSVDGNIIPYKKEKIKKNITSIKIPSSIETIENKIKNSLNEPVDIEAIQLLYKQSVKFKDEFTTKQSSLNWFLKRQNEVVDINHLLKIDSVLINII